MPRAHQSDARTASYSNQRLRLFNASQVIHLVEHALLTAGFEKAPQGGADTGKGHALDFQATPYKEKEQAHLLSVVLFCLLLRVPLRVEAGIKILILMFYYVMLCFARSGYVILKRLQLSLSQYLCLTHLLAGLRTRHGGTVKLAIQGNCRVLFCVQSFFPPVNLFDSRLCETNEGS